MPKTTPSTEDEEIKAQKIAAALQNPHQIFVVDSVLKLNISPFSSSVTFGNTVPNGQLIGAVTLTLGTDVLAEFAKEINEALKARVGEIKREQAQLIEKIK